MIIDKLKKFSHYIRLGGIYEVLLRLTAVEYLPAWLLFVCEAQILCLDTAVMQFVALQISDYKYDFSDRHRFDGLLACSSANMRTTLQRLFNIFSQEDCCCHAMKRDGQIIAYCWTFESRYTLTFDDYRRRNIQFVFSQDSRFLGNVFVTPKHRHRGVSSRLIHETVSRRPRGGRLYSWVDRTNNASLNAHRKAGFVPVSRILCVTLFGITRYWMSAAAEKVWRPVRGAGKHICIDIDIGRQIHSP